MRAVRTILENKMFSRRLMSMLRYGKRWLAAYRSRRENRRNAEIRQQELRQLREELAECRRQLRALESWFDLAADPHTVDSCIFQLCALQARYEGLLRRARLSPEWRGRVPVGSAKTPVRIQYGKAAELSAGAPQ